MEDEAHGVGTFKGVNGEFYQGEWQADKQHGVGVYRFVSGARYRGEWKYGKMDGYGIYENLEGQKFIGKYEGQMIQGKMDGLGLYCWAEGDVYVGEYSQDKRHGSGALPSPRAQARAICPCGRRSPCGGVRDSRSGAGAGIGHGCWLLPTSMPAARGAGIYTSMKGAVYKGEYDKGNRQGWGEYVNSSGDVYQGEWWANQRHGQAVVTMSHDLPDLADDLNPNALGDRRRWAQVRAPAHRAGPAPWA